MLFFESVAYCTCVIQQDRAEMIYLMPTLWKFHSESVAGSIDPAYSLTTENKAIA